MKYVGDTNKDNGWHDKEREFGTECALLHSEVSEMLEAYRDKQMVTSKDATGKPIGMPSEVADVFIRLLDVCYRYKIDLEEEFLTKMAYNETRGYRHGGKVV